MLVVIELFGVEAKKLDPQGAGGELVRRRPVALLNRDLKRGSRRVKRTHNRRQIIAEVDIPLGTLLEGRARCIGGIAELKRSVSAGEEKRRTREYLLKNR